MKKNEIQTSQEKVSPPDGTTKTLFDSVLEQESARLSEYHVQRLAERVGLVATICNRRRLSGLLRSFEDDVAKLVQSYCTKIDNELRTSSED